MTCQIMLGIYGRRKNRAQVPKLQSRDSTVSDTYFMDALLMYTSYFFLLEICDFKTSGIHTFTKPEGKKGHHNCSVLRTQHLCSQPDAQ